jgi:RNA polymerase sigma-70 factor (ECF subfamily)
MRKPSSSVPDAHTSPSDAAKGEFSAQFTGSFRILWLIALGVLGDKALAEDAVQDAVVIALGKLDQFKKGTNFTAWMGQMVRNVALNMARKESRRRKPLAAGRVHRTESTSDASTESLAKMIETNSAVAMEAFDDGVQKALMTLGDTARTCLLLRTVEGLDYAKISELLDIPAGTAMSHVFRSRTAIREQLLSLERAAGRSRRTS